MDELLISLPAIALEGPKAVGKTATARRRSESIYRLDDPQVFSLAQADTMRLLEGNKPILLDKWQRLPELWDAVRRKVDAGAGPGSFLLTGSASSAHIPTHSGAGRVVTVRMRPLSLSERYPETSTVSLQELLKGESLPIFGQTELRLEDYVDEIIQSGFPGIRKLKGRPHRAMIEGYLRRIVDTDFEEQGIKVRHPTILRNWMRAYAAAVATAISYETILDAATSGEANKPAKTTTLRYRETLERLWILDPLAAWLPTYNRLARLTGAQKHHLADPALAVGLLGLSKDSLLRPGAGGPQVSGDGSLLGHLFESLATLSVRVYAQQAEAKTYHLRTAQNKQEIDLIIERMDGKILGIEVKLARTVSDSDVKHLLWLKERLGEEMLDMIVLTAGADAYRRKDEVAVVPLALLGP